jgi:hypothetical protein
MTMSAIPDLKWRDNYCAETGQSSFTLVANPGPLITDFHYWNRNSYEAFIAHVGQDDRFTFLGDPSITIRGEFVDCRRATHGAVATMEFSPSAERFLTVPRGVAVFYSGLQGVTIRSEPVLYAPSSNDSDYSVGNDQIRITSGARPKDFPKLTPNELPLPPAVLQLINARQQEILRTGQPYESSFGVPSGDTIVRIDGFRG